MDNGLSLQIVPDIEKHFAGLPVVPAPQDRVRETLHGCKSQGNDSRASRRTFPRRNTVFPKSISGLSRNDG